MSYAAVYAEAPRPSSSTGGAARAPLEPVLEAVNGVSLAVVDSHADHAAGSSLPVVFFVSGSLASWRQHEPVADALREGHRVVLFDAVGCGESARSARYDDYHPDAMYASLEAVYDRHVGAAASTTLVAHSYGCSLCVRLAEALRRRGSPPRKVVLLGAPAFHGGLMMPWSQRLFFRLVPGAVFRWMQPGLSEGFCQGAVAKNGPRSTAVRAICLAHNALDDFRVCSFFYPQARLVGLDVLISLAAEVPVVFLTGTEDGICPAEGARLQAAAVSKNCFVTIDSASHLLMLEQPDAVLQHVRSG